VVFFIVPFKLQPYYAANSKKGQITKTHMVNY